VNVLGRRLAILALLPLALAACGSSNSPAAKQARIASALRKFERELIAEKNEVPPQLRGKDVLGALTLFYAPVPAGVSKAEWNAAISHDKRLRQLEKEASPAPNTGGPSTIELATPPAVAKASAHARAEYETGKLAVAQSGCLACHKIGDSGNTGPGPDLTEVGARLPRQAIERTLVAPTAPMPSFKDLPPAKFQGIVTFLAALK
jgi:mono/diheme cytochrome c family protein